VAAAIRETGWNFLVVGDGDKVKQHLNLDAEPEKTGFVSITDYPRRLSRCAVTIAPLEDGPFNEAKSALKILEASALGICWVASSNTSEYRWFAEHCLGSLVPDRGRNWRSALLKLMRDPGLRAERSEQNRAAIVEHDFTMESGSWRYLEAWLEAVVNHQAGMAA
jgi:glycosyltransferase involved in cell wall biosynthesis